MAPNYNRDENRFLQNPLNLKFNHFERGLPPEGGGGTLLNFQ